MLKLCRRRVSCHTLAAFFLRVVLLPITCSCTGFSRALFPLALLPPTRPLIATWADAIHPARLFHLQPKQIHEIKDFLLTARRKDARCE
jgi:hypothetical protein